MSGLRFAWDQRKAAANLRKHGVSFTEAQAVFADEHAVLIDDPDHSATEQRFILLGTGLSGRLLVVSHGYRADDELIRVISARKADHRERQAYQERERR